MVVGLGRHRRRARGNPPGHAEMQQQEAAVVEFDQDVLPRRVSARCARLEPFGETRREGPAQVGAAQLGAHDPPPGHATREAAADGFDFGKLRHPGLAGGVAADGYCRAR